MIHRLIVALGASNTQGYNVDPHQAYPAVLELLLLQAGMNVRIINAGVSGAPTAAMLARLDLVVPEGTSVVIFQPGSNDARLGLTDAVREKNIAIITQRLTDRGIPVVRVGQCFETVRHESISHLQADGIHFTAAGYARVAECLITPVMSALVEKSHGV